MEIVLVVLVVFSVAVVAFLTVAQSGDPPAPRSPAPDFRLAGADGVERSLGEFRGSRLAIVFHPQDETPECVAVVERVAGVAPAIAAAGAALVTVVVSGPEAARAYAAAHAPGLAVLCDADGRVARAYGSLVNLLAMRFAKKLIVLVDPHGRVERVWRAPVTPSNVDELRAALESATA
jgi:thioredoxin-dependent peroxiredoxin